MKVIRKVMAVVYDMKDGKPYYLILHRVLRWHGWELLKETVEDGEDLLQAIKRGIAEETGLKDFKIRGRLDYRFEWMWGDARVVVEDVFIIRADMSKQISLKQRIIEHDSFLWTDKNTAVSMLEYENSRKALELADRKLH